jgi:hypothetical protein
MSTLAGDAFLFYWQSSPCIFLSSFGDFAGARPRLVLRRKPSAGIPKPAEWGGSQENRPCNHNIDYPAGAGERLRAYRRKKLPEPRF